MALEAGLILFIVFAILLILGMPIAISVAVSSIATLLLVVPFDIAVFTSAQKMVSSLNSFSLVAIPFFVLSGIIMNGGGIAEKLVNFAMLFVGRVPGGLAHTNILGNALFGSMSSSAIAASTAIGGVLIPQQVKAGYDRKFATAANIASAPTGMVIPPSTAFIMYSLVASGASISSLFLGGYLVGALWALSIMIVAFLHAKRHNYKTISRSELGSVGTVLKEALPSVMLIVIIIGGILSGLFTAIEASAIAVAYSLVIAMFFYKTVTVKDIPRMLRDAVLTTGTIAFLLATSSMMSFAMAFTGIPQAISAAILGLTSNKYIILLLAEHCSVDCRNVYGRRSGNHDLYTNFLTCCNKCRCRSCTFRSVCNHELMCGFNHTTCGFGALCRSQCRRRQSRADVEAVSPILYCDSSSLVLDYLFPANCYVAAKSRFLNHIKLVHHDHPKLSR